MDENTAIDRLTLKNLVKRAVAKERHILSFSILVTVIAFGSGLIWIAYANSRVRKLDGQRAELERNKKSLEEEIHKKSDFLLSLNAEIEQAKSILDNVAQGKGATRQEATSALATLINVQQRIDTAINQQGTNKITEVQVPVTSPSPMVPDVKGLSFDEARKKVVQAGFSVRKVAQEGNGTSGSVLYQDPLPGTSLRKKAQVSLYVIPEKDESEVPTLKGLQFEAAEQAIRRAGLIVRKVWQDGNGAPGTVLYQDPLPGTLVPKNSTVSIYVLPIPKP